MKNNFKSELIITILSLFIILFIMKFTSDHHRTTEFFISSIFYGAHVAILLILIIHSGTTEKPYKNNFTD